MNPILEAKYIHINWFDNYQVRKITESFYNISIEDNSLDIVTYPKIENSYKLGQFALRFLDNKNSFEISIIRDNQKIKLKQIVNPDNGNIWWVENGDFIRSQNGFLYLKSSFYNRVGTVKIQFAENSFIDVNINDINLSADDLEKYINDFTENLWHLIFSKDSNVTGSKNKTVSLNDSSELINLTAKFIKYAENIIDNPKKELREIQELKNIKYVKPVPRTFMEIATKGMRKELTSRAYKESYNLAENRYVLYIIEKLSQILKYQSRYGTSYLETLQRKKDNLQKRFDSFSDEVVISKDVLENEIQDIQKQIIERKKLFKNFEYDEFENCPEQISNGYGYREFILYIISSLKQDKYYKDLYEFNIKFNENKVLVKINKRFIPLLESFQQYKVKVCRTRKYQEDKEFNRYKPFWILTINKVYQIEPIKDNHLIFLKDKLKNLKNDKIKYAEQSFKRTINYKERNEQEKEKKSIREQIQYLNENLPQNNEDSEKLNLQYKRVKNLLAKFNKLNIKIDSHFTGSMTFIQNNNYRGIHKTYKEIQNLSGVDESVFIKLFETDKIGIVDTPALYEKWVLLKIIGVLQKYRFIPQANWKEYLVEMALQNKYNIELEFIQQNLDVKLILTYEKVLKNGKRPDFVLDVFELNTNINLKRFVLDAKFKDFDENRIIEKEILTLFNKGYSEDNKNPVFVLHPSDKAITKQNSHQDWSKYSFYGEAKGNFKDFPIHNFGAIKLKTGYLDDLQRLIGMFLEYHLYLELCIVCGNSKELFDNSPKNGIKNYSCKECFHKFTQSYCWNCGGNSHNVLWKHDSYWSYHNNLLENAYDMKCPRCGMQYEDLQKLQNLQQGN